MPYETKKVLRATGRMLNPEKELREAAIAWDETPTVQNRLRLAQAQLGRGLFDPAIENFTACLDGPFSDDPNIRQGLASAYFAADNIQAAITQLETLNREHPDLDSEECDLLLARAYAAAQRNNEARALFEQTLQKFGTFPCEAEYAIWLLQQGERTAAQPLLEAIARRTRRWTRYNRQYYRDIFQRLKTAQNGPSQA